jgi:hypothetical protein
MLIAFLVCLFLAVLIGTISSLMPETDNAHWFWPLFIIICYIITFFAVNYYFKKQSNYTLRMSQFLLAVLCRVENNRLYLKHGVEVRPGFNAEWIEFCFLPNPDASAYIQVMRQRFLKPALEHKQKIFNEEVMNNRDLLDEQRRISEQIAEL